MKTYDYLKQANDALKQATQTCQSDINELRRAVANRDQEMRDHMNELKRREAQRLDEAARTDSDQLTASRMQDARMLRTEEGQVEQDYKKQKIDLDNSITLMQQILNELNQMTSQLDRQLNQISPTVTLP